MPINKSAHLRFSILDECLRNSKKKWTKIDLLNYLNRRLELQYGEGRSISVSQLRYDLEAMESQFGAPIQVYKEGRYYYYRYEEENFSIKNIPIQEEEFQILHTAVSLLQQIKGFTIADEIAEIVSKLENRYQFSSCEPNTIISFDSSPAANGTENLEDIYHAILRKTVLKIVYRPFNLTDKVWDVHPYLLKEYNKRWYLLGLCEEKNAVGTYALDRMKEIKVSSIPFKENTMLDAGTYFNDIIGVTKPAKGKIQQIDLLFSNYLTPYVLSKPIHSSQSTIKRFKDGALHVRLKLRINPELISLLLSFGKGVRILSPKELSLEIRSSALMLLNYYK